MDWTQLLSTFGAPMFVLVAIGTGAWRVTVWVGREMMIPARDRLFRRVDSFCDRVEASLDKQAEAITRLSERMPAAHATSAAPHSASERPTGTELPTIRT